ncbi:MAG: cytochrome c oxidase assembly protein [Solirubrobacteraceae bacterium]
MSLARWSIDPPLGYLAVAYVVVSAVLYLLGGRARGGTPLRREPLRALSFFTGLAVIVIALNSPIDDYADSLFWVHMVQHVLLLTVAPPLILLGHPWPRMWRAPPLRTRTVVGRTIAGSGFTAPLRALARPLPAWILFNVAVVAWHIPAAYNATLTSNVINQLEHAIFFFFGRLFWARVVDPGPLRPRLVWPTRIVYVAGAMVVGWVLAIALVVVQHPIYPHYAELVNRPGGLSALADQQIAGGVMWVLGSAAYTVTLLIGVYRWLSTDSAVGQRRTAVTT